MRAASRNASGSGPDLPTRPDLPARLRAALRGMPAPMALVTTCDVATGEPAGLAASAVIPVSLEPPAMLVCVNRAASAHSVIEVSGRFCINLIGAAQIGLVEAFASSAQRDLRFVVDAWGERHGLPYLPAAPASLFCEVRTTLLFGTHEAFVGELFDMTGNGAEKPVAWVDGGFAECLPTSRSRRTPVDTDAPRSGDRIGALQ